MSAIIRRINDELQVLCLLKCNFYFLSNDGIDRSYFCDDKTYLKENGKNISAGNFGNQVKEYFF